MSILCIDELAINKQRDILYLVFGADTEVYDWNSDVIRNDIIKILTNENISFEPCYSNVSCKWDGGYKGALYLDVPMDQSNDKYKKLIEIFEKDDGSMVYESVLFYYYPLTDAQEYQESLTEINWIQDGATNRNAL